MLGKLKVTRKKEMVWRREQTSDMVAKWGLFMVSPVLGLFYSFKNLKTKSSFWVIYLVGLLFGLCLTVEAAWGNADVTWYSDSMKHRAEFEVMSGYTLENYLKHVALYFTGYGEKDLYALTLKFVVSRFTTNYHIFFMVVAAIYGFFSLMSLKSFVAEKKFDNSIMCLILVYIFLSAQIMEINGIRFFTAGWVAVFSLMQVFIHKKKRSYILLGITPFIHSAFILFIGVFFLFLFAKKWPGFCYVLFYISFAVSEVFAQILSANVSMLPDFLAESAEFYLDAEFASRGVLYAIFDVAHRICINVFVIVVILTAKYHENNEKTKDMYLFVIMLAAFSNFAMSVPIVGARMQVLMLPFLAYVWLVNIYEIKRAQLMYLYPIASFYFIFYLTPRTYMRLLDPSFFYSSPLYLVAKNFFI